MNSIAFVLTFASAAVFLPQWQKIEPIELLNPPPEVETRYSYGYPIYKDQMPLPKTCAIYELDKIVGYRLTC